MKTVSRTLLILFLSVFLSFCSSNSDNKKESSRPSTVQSNVRVLEKKFEMPGLNRDRQIRIYLPKDYQLSDQKYSVLYMHDGQNLFDDSTSYAGEWGVDESLNQLAETSEFKLIVVGIDHGREKRISEMSPWKKKVFDKAKGREYMEFIVYHIKPFIDSTYRTLPDRNNTAIMGSSMAGLISHYAIYSYPEVFGKAGIFSPSWYSDLVYDYTLNNPIPKDSRLFLLVGGKEGDMNIDASKKMYNYILESGHPKENLNLIIDPEEDHNEVLWRKQFVPAIRWLFSR